MKNLLFTALLCLSFLIADNFCSASGGSVPASVPSNLITVKYFTVTLDGASNTLDVATAAGDCYIKSVTPFVKVIPTTGAATSAIVTNEGVPKTLLAAAIHSTLQTTGATLTAYVTPFLLADTKKIQRVNVGTGAGGGSMLVAVEYYTGSSCTLS